MAKTYFATQEWVKEQIGSAIPKEFGGSFKANPGIANGGPSGVTYTNVITTVDLKLPTGISAITSITFVTTLDGSSHGSTITTTLTKPEVSLSLYSTNTITAKFEYVSGGLKITVSNNRPDTYTVDYTVKY